MRCPHSLSVASVFFFISCFSEVEKVSVDDSHPVSSKLDAEAVCFFQVRCFDILRLRLRMQCFWTLNGQGDDGDHHA